MRLSEYIDELQMVGRIYFSFDEAFKAVGASLYSWKKAVGRLIKQNKLLFLYPSFYVIIPVEFRKRGIVPPDYFIDPWMKHLGLSYYVGLLSAGEIHGAAHQRPQQYQVMIQKYKKPYKKENLHIKFFTVEKLNETPVQRCLSSRAYVQVSTPEVTALDLVKYYRKAGYLSNVATVLFELVEKIKTDELMKLIDQKLYEFPVIQRLGYLLTLVDEVDPNLIQAIADRVKQEKPRFALLDPSSKIVPTGKDGLWRIWINNEVEPDLW